MGSLVVVSRNPARRYRSRTPTCDCQPIDSSPNVDNQCLVCRFAELMTCLSNRRFSQAPLGPALKRD